MDVLYLLITALIVILMIILIFNLIFYKYYVDPTDDYPLASFTTVISMSIALLCVLLIPIDIFLITYKSENFEKLAERVKLDRSYFQTIMLSLYGLSLFISFFMIPFSYFYGDERIEDIQPKESELKEKICNSFKYTIVFVLFCAIVIISGLYFRQGDSVINTMKNGDNFKWVKSLFDTDHMGEQAISFVVSIFSVFGMAFIILYTGYGLAALPFYLIKGKKSLSTAHQEFEMDKAQIRERIRSLQEKLSRKGSLSNKEKKELTKLREEEQSINKKITKISGLLESDKVINKVLTILTPFRLIIGIIFLIFSLLIFVSLLVTSLDRLLHSKCGLDCGYVLDDMNYTNYLDFFLLWSSKYFHMDLLIFAVINIYVFICSIYGFVRLGVKFFVFTWFDIRKQSTNPQGLLVMSFKICLMILAFMLQILTLAPQYSTFGTQKFSKSSVQGEVPCKLSLINSIQESECVMSNISKFYNRISISLPFFSTIFYFANWLMITIGFISLIYAGLCRQEDVLDDIKDSDDEEKKILIDERY